MNSPSILNARVAPLAERLRCPSCLGPRGLRLAPSALHCDACGAVSPVDRGRPVLLNDAGARMRQAELGSAAGQAMVDEYAAATPSGPPPRPWWRPPGLIHDKNPNMDAAFVQPLFDHAGPGTVVLNVGGGPRRYRSRDINLNIGGFVNVDLIADAHQIPLLDASVDSVICISVLEHVRWPEQVVAEMLRVLKPGGHLYAEIPFIFFIHGYPSDYRRYSYEGMRLLFGELDGLEVGLSGGPISAWLQTTNIVLEDLLPPKWRMVRKAFNGLYRWLLFPLKYIDHFYYPCPQRPRVVCAYRAYGRKPAAGSAGG
jgi:SAM-dependent methyltransferase